MNLLELQADLRQKVIETAKENFSVELENIASEVPPKTELGDLAFPVAFELAKRIKQATGEKKNPREIAEQLKNALETNVNVERVEVAGAGYLNVFYKRANFLSDFEQTLKSADENSVKSCVEHTSVNPNKAAHIGHVRNAVLGDTFVRTLRANGEKVEVQNYIDNTGVQVADVVVGFIYLEKMNLDDIKKLDESLEISFDYYCWDLYAKVGQAYLQDEDLKAKRVETLHLIEAGNNETAELADYVATRNVECILQTMERFDIRYDLLPRESEILRLKFWATAFEKMKQLGVVRFEDEGKNKGCWVMPFDSHSGNDEHDADKILVKSNGIVTYTGKDIAYQMWKLGLLDLDFFYKPFSYKGYKTWVTSDVAVPIQMSLKTQPPKFGKADKVYNVIDTRQSYPQEIVRKGVAAISPEKGEKASIHLSYEMVALSPSAAIELGFELSEEDKAKSFVEMSGRKGLGVKADDLLNLIIEKALAKIKEGNRVEGEEEQIKVAKIVAVGSLRYFLLKFTRNTLIVFDFNEALAFEGETGAYCQNATVRLNSIFRKLEENALENASKIVEENKANLVEAFDDEVWSLICASARLEEIITQAAENNEPAILAKYTFNLAKTSNVFYNKYRIIVEENQLKRAVWIKVADIARQSLTLALKTLGIEVPEKM
jgi:arginyl-tRNA synthetase